MKGLVIIIFLLNIVGCSSDEYLNTTNEDVNKYKEMDLFYGSLQKESFDTRVKHEEDIKNTIEEILTSLTYQEIAENHESISKLDDSDLSDLLKKIRDLRYSFIRFGYEKTLHETLVKDNLHNLDVDLKNKIEDLDRRIAILEQESQEKIFIFESLIMESRSNKRFNRVTERARVRSDKKSAYFSCRLQLLEEGLQPEIKEQIRKKCIEIKKELDEMDKDFLANLKLDSRKMKDDNKEDMIP